MSELFQSYCIALVEEVSDCIDRVRSDVALINAALFGGKFDFLQA